MDENARKAFDKLRARGVDVQDAVDYHGDDDEQAHVHFVLQARSYDGSNCFADMSGDWIRESYVNGEFIKTHPASAFQSRKALRAWLQAARTLDQRSCAEFRTSRNLRF